MTPPVEMWLTRTPGEDRAPRPWRLVLERGQAETYALAGFDVLAITSVGDFTLDVAEIAGRRTGGIRRVKGHERRRGSPQPQSADQVQRT